MFLRQFLQMGLRVVSTEAGPSPGCSGKVGLKKWWLHIGPPPRLILPTSDFHTSHPGHGADERGNRISDELPEHAAGAGRTEPGAVCH